MSTSGSTLFQLTTNQIIEAALRKLGVLAKGQSADAEDLAKGLEALNVLWGRMITIGMPLWKRTTITFPIVAGTANYNIGVGQTINTPFPLKIQQAVLEDLISKVSLEMNIYSLYEYYSLNPAYSSGQPVSLFYTPKINTGEIILWPTPDATAAAQKVVRIVYQAPFDDFVNSTDTPDFPKEWNQAIVYELAVALAPEYGIPLEERNTLKAEAKQYKEDALSFGTDEASIFVQPERR